MSFEEEILRLSDAEYTPGNEENLRIVETKDNFDSDEEEPNSKSAEAEANESAKEDKEDKESRTTHDEQFRLFYIYLKEMAKEPLLTAKEEIRIAAMIKKCEAREKEIKKSLEKLFKKLNAKSRMNGHMNGNGNGHLNGDMGNLIKRIQRLDFLMRSYSEKAKQLKERFTKANLRLVVSIANKYVNRGLPLLDLIQEGNMGLMKAVEKFDHTKGYRFSTYAMWWIQQAVTRALMEKTRVIKIPTYILEQSNKVHRISSLLHNEMGEAPMPETIAEEGGIPVEVVKQILEATGYAFLDIDSYAEEYMVTPGSEKINSMELISDKNSLSPDSFLMNTVLKQKTIEEALSTLNPKQEEIIRMRFEIGHKSKFTLDEIGKKFNLTRERIRQIEREALKKLRKSEMKETLRSFLE